MTLTIDIRHDLGQQDERAVRSLMEAAFDGDFGDDDWQHALGGVHAVAVDGNYIVGHAAVVPRVLWVGARRLDAGYIEAVAVAPDRQGCGIGTAVMRALEPALETFALCALSTGEHGFYSRLGWRSWRGPTWVRTPTGRIRTADEDAGIMVRFSAGERSLDLSSALICEPRVGDDW